MNKSGIFKFLGALAVVAGFIGIALLVPNLPGAKAIPFPGDHEVELSGPSSVQAGNSATYTGTITWTGSQPPSRLGYSKYSYKFTYTDGGTTRETPEHTTPTSSAPLPFNETITFSSSGSARVCFIAVLMWDGGSETKQTCMTTSVTGDGGGNPPPIQDEVSVTITAHPNPIFRGDSSTLTWNSTNADRCSASGGWFGSKPVDGSQNVSPTVTTTFTITCSNDSDTASDSVTVVVQDRPSQEICGDGRDNDGDGLVDENCPPPPRHDEICGNGIDDDGDGRVDENCPPPPQNEICGDGIDNDHDGRVDENCPTPQQSSVDLRANPTVISSGGSSTLTWTTNFVESCISSANPDHPLWPDGARVFPETDGSKLITNIRQTTTFTLTCLRSGDKTTISDSATVTVRSGNPPTVDLSANPRTINRGAASTLVWTSQNADFCTASGSNEFSGTVTRNGSQVVHPNRTTTYTVTCTNQFGSDSDSDTVTVRDVPPPPGEVTVRLTANPTVINQGQSSTLQWDSTNATTCSLNQGIGNVPVDGSRVVRPNNTTTYTITCSNPRLGSARDNATVTVRDQPDPLPTVDLTANPTVIDEGDTSRLTWTSQNADFCRLDQGIGSVERNGSRVVSPNDTTTYTITCTNQRGSATDSATVRVIEDDDDGRAPIVDLTADDTRIDEGDSTFLRWDVDNNADFCTASNSENDSEWRGDKDEDGGSQRINPDEDTTYTLRCTNRFGSDSDSVTVRVDDDDDEDDDEEDLEVDLTADDTLLTRGESTTLRWDVDGDADECEASNSEDDNEWEGDVDEDGGRQTIRPDETTTYRIRCENDDDSDSDSVTVRVVDQGTFSVSCSAFPSAVQTGQIVTFSAQTAGARGSVRYSWNGDASGSGQTATASYGSPGTRVARVTATDDNRTVQAFCSVSVFSPGVTPPTRPFQPPSVFTPPAKKECPTCPCTCQGGGTVINNTNTINFGGCPNGGEKICPDGSAAFNSNDDDDENGNGFLASVGDSGIGKAIGYLVLFVLGLLLLALFVFIILELIRAMRSRAATA